jgi:uncharacterized FAD-dependent dehydrogenase
VKSKPYAYKRDAGLTAATSPDTFDSWYEKTCRSISPRQQRDWMITELEIVVTPEQAAQPDRLSRLVAGRLKFVAAEITALRILRHSIDARKRPPKVNLRVRVYRHEQPSDPVPDFGWKSVDHSPSVIVVGAGPAGLFAALKLVERGIKPIVLERGRDVHVRKIDIATLCRNRGLDPDSNYCFGEGGAGTFSDGKLYTRSKKKGDIGRILQVLHDHGADESILYEAHPHIGSDRLPRVIEAIRKTIIHYGGEIHFDKRVTELVIKDARVCGCKTACGDSVDAAALILATGHSAHDVYAMLDRQGIAMEAKGFAMGVRAEHPQALVDRAQYHLPERGEWLPAASYALKTQVEARGVYSFCMCPGGHIVPAASHPEQIVVNGMSAARRNSPHANAGIVVEIRPEDVPVAYGKGPLAGLRFQQALEHQAFLQNGGNGQAAPAQRLADFVAGRKSDDLPACSYFPGIVSSALHDWMPAMLTQRLREAFKHFDRRLRGYLTNEAVVVAVESRSSSPVRIPRDSETGEHPAIAGFFPCGEGAGYAGGITSSALDGEHIAMRVADMMVGEAAK